ncbi:hypothetical protein PACTADRAFT_48171 [Pachysolen tannophilus NRRL Y-2460]|uniref:Protein YTP1-like C-terminal domain-containing protein n=1 Tax=Pachysolen tannophilus NRRL Y-2460 TaxID=669874 RepID=A0A1E4U3C1_PACTA|nr:hypothetical protein PACTADRAFT_48171 [Pachysolen tannophilus NRRL Y-2460]
MDMDMAADTDDETSVTTSTSSLASSESSGEIIPVAHEEKHAHGVPILDTKLTEAERLYWEAYNTTTYFTVNSSYRGQLLVHFGLVLVSLIFVYPICLVLDNINSNWYIPSLTLNFIMMVISLFCYMTFITNVEDLYPKNCYGKMGVILFFLVTVHYFAALVRFATKWINGGNNTSKYYDLSSTMSNTFIPLNDISRNECESPASTLFSDDAQHAHGGIGDVGDATTTANDGSSHSPRDDSLDLDAGADAVTFAENEGGFKMQQHAARSKLSVERDALFNKIFQNQHVTRIVGAFDHIANFAFALLNYMNLIYLYIYTITGVAVLNLLGLNGTVFNLLAHFIKGGVFFALGVLSLARYCGGFEKCGLAWNHSFISKYEHPSSIYLRFQPISGMLTMEMIESSLILFYGSTNIFLEHLAAAGGAWTAKDLQHVSIAFMYIGCGLCGVITEVKLNSWRRNKFMAAISRVNESSMRIDPSIIKTCTPGYSLNPFPAFTIFFTGLLMSRHAQASALSTSIHVQWGSLLSYGSFFRLFTFVLLTFWPYNDAEDYFKPSRPFTELFTSFALLAGGAVFMESTDPIVQALEYRGFTEMFTLNVSIGCVTLLMGWIMFLFAVKDKMKKL